MTTQVITGAAAGQVSLPFTDVELTDAINQLPTPFGQLTGEGFFPGEGIATQFVEIDIINGVVSVLPVTGDGPASQSRHENALARIFKVPTIAHQDNMMAGDIRSMFALAARTRRAETMADLMNRRLVNFKRKFNLTWEYMRMGALKGNILDGKGNQILNFYDAFEITQKTVYFNFTDGTGDVHSMCDLVYQLISQDLSDETMTGVEARVSRNFFNQLVAHPSVNKYWLQAEQALQLASVVRGTDGGYRPRQFDFGNIRFIEYPAVVPLWGGTSAPIVASGMGHAYPAGTQDSHTTFIAPPADIRVLDGSAASIDDAIHITTEPMKHGKGVEILGQMNTLPFWKRPKLLVTLNAGSGSSTAATDGE